MFTKPAPAAYPLHSLLLERWSPRAFAPTPIGDGQLLQLLEAARWAPSGGNVQPWSFIVARRDENAETFAQLAGCLNESNRIWAQHAPLLILAVARLVRDGGKPNPTALYDLGQAVAHLTVQARVLGFQLHQMGGFSADEARLAFAIPEEHQPVTAIAVGVTGDPETLPENLRERERAARTRKPLADFVFDGPWGRTAALVEAAHEEHSP